MGIGIILPNKRVFVTKENGICPKCMVSFERKPSLARFCDQKFTLIFYANLYYCESCGLYYISRLDYKKNYRKIVDYGFNITQRVQANATRGTGEVASNEKSKPLFITNVMIVNHEQQLCPCCERKMTDSLQKYKIMNSEQNSESELEGLLCNFCGSFYISEQVAKTCESELTSKGYKLNLIKPHQYCRFKNADTRQCEFPYDENIKGGICRKICINQCKYYSITRNDNKLVDDLKKKAKEKEEEARRKTAEEEYKRYINSLEILDWTNKLETLHIYKGVSYCVSREHPCKDYIAKVFSINGRRTYHFHVFYCEKCKKYCASSAQIKHSYSSPKVKLVYESVDERGFRFESKLHMYGYSVGEFGPAASERREIISFLIDYELMSIPEMISYMSSMIKLHQNDDRWYLALPKMKDDLEFVSTYKIKTTDVCLKLDEE